MISNVKGGGENQKNYGLEVEEKNWGERGKAGERENKISFKSIWFGKKNLNPGTRYISARRRGSTRSL